MKTLVSTNEFLSEDVKLEKKLMKRESPDEYPSLLKWKIQMLYFDGAAWVQICRMDNYLHDGSVGSHVHTYGNDQVKWLEVSFQEAYDLVFAVGSRILREKFRRHVL